MYVHNDLEVPPSVPAITGNFTYHKKEKSPIIDALAGAATAITQVLVNNSNQRPVTPPSTSAVT